MTRILLSALALTALIGCQTTTTPASGTQTVPLVQDESAPGIARAVKACTRYVATGSVDAADLFRNGFVEGRSVVGPNYTLKVGNRTIDRINLRKILVTPSRNARCGVTLSGVGGNLITAANSVTQGITSQGYAFTPEGRQRIFTKGDVRILLTGSTYNGLHTFTLSRQ